MSAIDRARRGHRRRRRPASARRSSASAGTAAASGVVIADGQVLTNAHNLRGDEVTVTFADGRSTRGTVARRRPRRRPRRHRGRHRRRRADRLGRRRRAGRRRTPCSARRRRTAAGRGSRSGFVSAVARAFRGPGGRRIAGSVEHTAPLAPGLVGRRARRRRGPPRRAQHEPHRRGLLPRPAGRRRPRGPGRRARPRRVGRAAAARASRSPRTMSRGGCAGRSACRSATASSSVASRTTALAAAAGIEAGDLIVSAGGRAVTDGDDLFDALGALELPFELGRGPRRGRADVIVGAPTGRTPATPDRRAGRRLSPALASARDGAPRRLVSRRLVGRRRRRPDRGQRRSRSSASCSSAGTSGRSSSSTGSRTGSSASSTSSRCASAEGDRRRAAAAVTINGRPASSACEGRADPVLRHALRDLLGRPRHLRADPAAVHGADRRPSDDGRR